MARHDPQRDASDSQTGDADEHEGAPVSKSQLKREARAMFDFGKRLVELPDSVLRSLPLDSRILEEILFARSITSRVARKRQLGFLASRLRAVDMTPVEAALDKRQEAARELNARHHRAEAWRDRLLEGDSRALGVLLDARRDLDAQALRQLLRNAQREAAANKPPASARKLFRMLREADEDGALPPLD